MLSSIHDLVGELGLSVPESELDVLKLVEARLCSNLELVSVRATLTIKEAEIFTNFGAVGQLEERLGETRSGVEELQTPREELWAAWHHYLPLFVECYMLAVNVGRVTADRDTATARARALQAEALDWDQQLGGVIEAVRRLEAKVKDVESRATSVEACIQQLNTKNVELYGLTEDLNQTVSEECAHAAGVMEAEVLRFGSVRCYAFLEGEVLVIEAIDAFADEVPVGTSSTAAHVYSSHTSYGKSYSSIKPLGLLCSSFDRLLDCFSFLRLCKYSKPLSASLYQVDNLGG